MSGIRGVMGKKVLVVEDYADSREFLKYLLEDYGCDVIEASNGREAIEVVKEQAPDLVLMDVSMPVMDGLTAARRIREEKEFQTLPIIVLTADTEGVRSRVIDAGCNGLLHKPLNFDELKPVLRHFLLA
ncbi:MAG: response regulator [Acidobacteriota bacterium]